MKSSMKKIITLLFTLALIVSVLAACGDKTEKTEDEPKNTPTAAPTKEPEKDSVEQEDEPKATPIPTEAPVDLGGITVTIADWWTTDPPAPPKNQKEEDTLAYREEMEAKYNFKFSRINLATWMEYQEMVVTSIVAGDPAADVFFMDQRFMAAPLSQNLLYPLNTLDNFDFTEEKWNQSVLEMMTVGGNVYGMANGMMEPRLGIFWNKRLFEEAGVDPELPYDLQASGQWTWEAFEDIARRTTRDTNGDGTPDIYGLASFSKEFFRGCVFSNNAKFIGLDSNGKFYNATGEDNFLEALEWGISLYDKGYHMPQPEGSEWSWFGPAFHDTQVAMQCAEEYNVSNWADMEDDWGFVIFPKGPKGEMMTVFTENAVVMPYNLDKDRAEKVAFAYDIYTDVTPGYEDDDWKTPYYAVFRDSRAVEETLPLFYEPGHGTISYLSMIAGLDYGDVTYDLDARALTPVESVEKVQALWQAHIDAANGVETAE